MLKSLRFYDDKLNKKIRLYKISLNKYAGFNNPDR